MYDQLVLSLSAQNPVSDTAPARPRVSVCMATYNGERYLRQQIDSILPQLTSTDELVVVDDGSRDTTVDIVRSYADPRIVLIVRPQNGGVIVAFDDAVSSASGDILFLCDMDDIWVEGKVDKTLGIFAENPEVDIVATSIDIIDENGNRVSPVSPGRPFRAGFLRNILRNSYQGSAMAFRSSLLPHVLPFPRRQAFLHDAWIGTRAALLGHRTHFLDEALLLYRRHGNNVSRPLSLRKQVLSRVQLFHQHLRRLLRDMQ